MASPRHVGRMRQVRIEGTETQPTVRFPTPSTGVCEMRDPDRRHRHRPFWYLRRRRETVQSEIDEELKLHLEMRTADLKARGLPPDVARREALRQFGDLPGTREYCRRQNEE